MNVEEYIENIPEERRLRVVSIIDLIKELYPNSLESMKYKMPTYELAGAWVSVANQKNYVSLYTCSAEKIEEFKGKYPRIKTGKGCINFTDKVEIPLNDVKGVINKAMSKSK